MKLQLIHKNSNLDIFSSEMTTEIELPLVNAGLSAGFPSPAEDYIDLKLDLNKELIKNPGSTFFGRVNGNSMIDAGIKDGDILVIDKSMNPKENSVLVCFIDGEFTVKKLTSIGTDLYLMPQNPTFKPIKINTESDFRLWGVVTYSIHKQF